MFSILILAELMVPTKIKTNIPYQTMTSSFHTPPLSLMTPSVGSNGFDEGTNNPIDNSVQTLHQLLE